MTGQRPKIGRPLTCGDLHGCTTHGRTEGREYQRPDGYTVWKCAPCHREHAARYRARQSHQEER